MATKTKKTSTNNRTSNKPTAQSRTTGGRFGTTTNAKKSTSRKALSGQMNKGMSGASKPPKTVAKPAGGSKGGGKPAAGGKRGC